MDLAHIRYADRFNAAAYADDEPVAFFVADDDPDALWVPERLFQRFVYVARAYSLHLLPLLGGHEPVTLQRAQIETLLDEVGFVGALLATDPLVAAQATRLHGYLRDALTSGPDVAVTVEGG